MAIPAPVYDDRSCQDERLMAAQPANNYNPGAAIAAARQYGVYGSWAEPCAYFAIVIAGPVVPTGDMLI